MRCTIKQKKPTEVSLLVVDQHRALAKRLEELGHVAKNVSDGGPMPLAHAVELSSLLCDELLDHIAIEGYFLVPTLREMDAWGDSRARKLLHQLSIRRHEIELFLASCAKGDCNTLGSAIQRFIDDRRYAMARAEIGVLSFLRDDVVSVDAEGG